MSLYVHTIRGKDTTSAIKVHERKVRGYNEEMEIQITSAYSTKVNNAERNQIPRTETACNWPHLNVISDKLKKYNQNIDKGLLIGLNCTRANSR